MWSLRGFDLVLFEDGLVAARVTARETWKGLEQPEGLKKPLKGALLQRMRLDAKGAQSISELVGADPANRIVPITAVREATLRRGWIASKLALTLSDGETIKWVWSGRGGANRPFEDVGAALRRMFGSRLKLAGGTSRRHRAEESH